MIEIWKDIPGYEGYYQVSDFGNVKNVKNDNILKPFDRQPNSPRKGYMTVHLVSWHLGKRFINKSVHSLVLLAFVGKRKPNDVIHHIDHNPSNNALSNLIYCTQSYNRKQDFIDGTQSFKGEKNNLCKITTDIALNIIKLRNSGIKNREIAEMYNLTISGVSSVYNGYTWSHVTGLKNKKLKNEII